MLFVLLLYVWARRLLQPYIRHAARKPVCNCSDPLMSSSKGFAQSVTFS